MPIFYRGVFVGNSNFSRVLLNNKKCRLHKGHTIIFDALNVECNPSNGNIGIMSRKWKAGDDHVI